MHTVPTSERPADHPVRRAIAALITFAGDGLDRDRAGRLLADWEHFNELDPHDLIEVAMHFPPEPPRRSLPGGGMSSGPMVMPGVES